MENRIEKNPFAPGGSQYDAGILVQWKVDAFGNLIDKTHPFIQENTLISELIKRIEILESGNKIGSSQVMYSKSIKLLYEQVSNPHRNAM